MEHSVESVLNTLNKTIKILDEHIEMFPNSKNIEHYKSRVGGMRHVALMLKSSDEWKIMDSLL